MQRQSRAVLERACGQPGPAGTRSGAGGAAAPVRARARVHEDRAGRRRGAEATEEDAAIWGRPGRKPKGTRKTRTDAWMWN